MNVVFEELYNAFCTKYDPDMVPRYLRDDPRRPTSLECKWRFPVWTRICSAGWSGCKRGAGENARPFGLII